MESKINYTRAEADEIIVLIKEKLKADTSKQKGIRAKIRKRGFRASDFGFRDGYTVADFLSVAKIIGSSTSAINIPVKEKKPVVKSPEPKAKKAPLRSKSDESYIIDLCDEVLKQKALRQYRFDFLKGDAGTKLPVDAYYPGLNLVVEYREKQHSEEVKFFDRRQTVSGMGRGEQRKLYDQRRRDVLPKQGIKLIELSYDDFERTLNKKLARHKDIDVRKVKDKLKDK
jgi:hypothetical protein